jgi:hypothetical protein
MKGMTLKVYSLDINFIGTLNRFSLVLLQLEKFCALKRNRELYR